MQICFISVTCISCPRMLLRPLLKGSPYTCSIVWLAFIENSKSKMIFDKYTTLNSTSPVSISHIHVTTICFWSILKKIYNHLLIIHNYFFFSEMISLFVFGLTLASLIERSSQHGLLLSPPQRGSLWRFGYDTPPNYDDNGLFCGGLEVNTSLFGWSSKPFS